MNNFLKILINTLDLVVFSYDQNLYLLYCCPRDALLKFTAEHGVAPCSWDLSHFMLLQHPKTPFSARCIPTSLPITGNKCGLHPLSCISAHSLRTPLACDHLLLSPQFFSPTTPRLSSMLLYAVLRTTNKSLFTMTMTAFGTDTSAFEYRTVAEFCWEMTRKLSYN